MSNMLNASDKSFLASVNRLTQTFENQVCHFYLKPLTKTYFLDLKSVKVFPSSARLHKVSSNKSRNKNNSDLRRQIASV